MHRFLVALIMTAVPAGVLAQGRPDLRAAAEQARLAWFGHNPAALVADSPRLMIQLPGAEPSVALGPDQAAASGQEVETLVRAAREVGPGRGYVELQRRFRVAGTQNVRTQALLLGYRLGQRGWVLVEFRVVG